MSGTKLSFRELVSLGLKPGDAWGEEKRALEKELDRYDGVAPSYASYGGPQAWDHRQAPVAPQHSRASSAGPGYISWTPSNLAGRTSAASKSTGRSYPGTYPEPPAARTSYHGPGPTQTSRSSSSRGSTGYPSNGTIPERTFASKDSSHRSYNSQPPVRVPGGYYTEPASTHRQHSRSSSYQDNVYPVAERPFATLDSKSRSDSPSTYHQPLPQAQAAYGHYHRAGSPSGSVVSTASTSQGYVRHAPSTCAYTQDPHGYANPNSESLTTSHSTWSGYRDYSAYNDERSSRSNSSYASSVPSTVSPSYTYSPPQSSVYQTYHHSGDDDDALNARAAYSSSGSGLGQYTAEDFGEVERCSGYVHVEYLDENDEDGHDDASGGEWGDSVHDEEFDDEEGDFDDGYDDDGGGDFDDDDYYDDDGGYSD